MVIMKKTRRDDGKRTHNPLPQPRRVREVVADQLEAVTGGFSRDNNPGNFQYP
jgi:hypothetical protein